MESRCLFQTFQFLVKRDNNSNMFTQTLTYDPKINISTIWPNEKRTCSEELMIFLDPSWNNY